MPSHTSCYYHNMIEGPHTLDKYQSLWYSSKNLPTPIIWWKRHILSSPTIFQAYAIYSLSSYHSNKRVLKVH